MRTVSVVLLFLLLVVPSFSLCDNHIPPNEEKAYKQDIDEGNQEVHQISPSNVDTCMQVIKLFYRYLLSQKKVTIKEFSEIYSSASEDGEASLLLKKDGFYRFDMNKSMLVENELRQKKDSLESLTLNAIREHTDDLTFGLGLDSICQLDRIIRQAEVSDDGESFSWLFFLSFPNQHILHFSLTNDTPVQITAIWLNNGENLYRKVSGCSQLKLKRPGTVNVRMESIDVMEKPDSSSAVVGLIMRGEVFYYTPVGGEEWWPVYPKEGDSQQGYVHRSQIVTYKDFPPELKEEVRKQRGGC